MYKNVFIQNDKIYKIKFQKVLNLKNKYNLHIILQNGNENYK